MLPSDSPAQTINLECASELTRGVLARLPAAERQRSGLRHRQRRQSLATAVFATFGLVACLGPETSNLATRALAWLIATGAAWHAVVRTMLDGLAFLPPLSALFLLVAAMLLWQRLIHLEHRQL